LSWKIRKGINNKVGNKRIMDYLGYFMLEHLETHFQMEEEYLFAYLAKNDLLRKEAENQHEGLRALYSKMAASPEVVEGDLREFADGLESHIRFEERKLFPYIQVELLEKDLREFQEKMVEIHEKVKEDWQDEFWLKN
jgi:hemerythrin-like domain-containing protein